MKKKIQTPDQQAAVAYVTNLFPKNADGSVNVPFGIETQEQANALFTMLADAFVAGRKPAAPNGMREGTIMVKDSLGTSLFHRNGEIEHVEATYKSRKNADLELQSLYR